MSVNISTIPVPVWAEIDIVTTPMTTQHNFNTSWVGHKNDCANPTPPPLLNIIDEQQQAMQH